MNGTSTGRFILTATGLGNAEGVRLMLRVRGRRNACMGPPCSPLVAAGSGAPRSTSLRLLEWSLRQRFRQRVVVRGPLATRDADLEV